MDRNMGISTFCKVMLLALPVYGQNVPSILTGVVAPTSDDGFITGVPAPTESGFITGVPAPTEDLPPCTVTEPAVTSSVDFTSTFCPDCESHTTTYETVFSEFCSGGEGCTNGLRPKTFTIAEECENKAGSPCRGTGLPPNFRATTAVCTVCGPEHITATLTGPEGGKFATIYETVVDEFCSTGLQPKTFTATEVCDESPCQIPTGLPKGFVAEPSVCTVCGPEPISATITHPEAAGKTPGEAPVHPGKQSESPATPGEESESPSAPGGGEAESPAAPGGGEAESPAAPGGGEAKSPAAPGGGEAESPAAPGGGEAESPAAPGGGEAESPAAPGGGEAESPAAPGGGEAESPAAPGGGEAESPAAPGGGSDAPVTSGETSDAPRVGEAESPAGGEAESPVGGHESSNGTIGYLSSANPTSVSLWFASSLVGLMVIGGIMI
ncbi:MAG: hypothetical protein M1837_001314 [Sclerophora amabilis]|nr:MAG: hypothetical protein M1837_001314 [Sclerophora amabilis]